MTDAITDHRPLADEATAAKNDSGAISGFADFTHAYILDMIQLADQKAAFVSTMGSALLAFLHHERTESRWFKALPLWSANDLLALVAMTSLAAAVVSALLVVVPRTRGSRRGYLFWGSIAEFGSPAEYGAAVTRLNADELTEVKLQHCHELSRICQAKYRSLNFSIRIGMLALSATVIYLLSVH